MSGYASVILRPGGVIYHTAWASSHKKIVRAFSLINSGVGAERRFLRAGAVGGDMARYYADEDDPDHLPAWYTRHEAEYLEKLAELLGRISALREKKDILHYDFLAQGDALGIEYEEQREMLRLEAEAENGAPDANYEAKWDALYTNYVDKRLALAEAQRIQCALLESEYLSLPGAVDVRHRACTQRPRHQ